MTVPLPRSLARFNLRVTNPLLSPLAARLPGFGILEHVGRRSGQVRHTPVNLFRAGEGYVVALMYGPDSQWVKNVLAAGGCAVQTRGRRVALTGPEMVRDDGATRVPRPLRPLLRALRVRSFMVLRRTP